MRRTTGALLLTLSGLACGDAGPASTPGARFAIHVAPLSLPGVTNVSYTLAVTNESGDPVWQRTLDADGAGDGAGSVSWVGPCDADDDPNDDGAATNTVSVVIGTVTTAAGGDLVDGVDFSNPAPAAAPVTRTIVCRANADVPVDFELTVARRATQGFFDVAMSFEDIFCSAKLDCVRDGQPLELLFNADGARDRTVVLGFACTGGAGSDTVLYMDAVHLACASAGSADLVPTGPAGNKGAVPPIVFQHAVYFGAELLGSGATSWGKAYWNLAIGIDEAALSTTDPCVLTAHATATSTRFDAGAAPAATTWPQVDWSVTLNAPGSATLTCANHAVFDAGSGVSVSYASGVVWPFEMVPDLPNAGAGATAGDSGGNASAPAWSGAADLGALAYAATLDVTLTATDDDPADTVTYMSPDLPAWLTLDPATGRLSGATVAEAALGDVSFTVVASDGLHQTPRTFTLHARFAGACDVIKAAQPTLAGVAVHTIDPAGDGTGVFEALCDMTTYGGGWTLVAAQFEADPTAAWDEGRQADYDATLTSGASFALTGQDLVGHNQVAFGRAAPLGGGGFDTAMLDYVHFAYDPAADYLEVPVNGLATTNSYQLDRHLVGVHNQHDPEQILEFVPEWYETLSLDQGGAARYSWAFSRRYPTPDGRGFGYVGDRHTAPDDFAWAVWVREQAGSAAPSYASCDAWKAANPAMTGLSVQAIDPSGAAPYLAMCDMSSFAGGWTLVAINYETNPISWDEGRRSTYNSSLRWGVSFALTGADLPLRTEAAFGHTQYAAPGAWTHDMIDFIDVVYDPTAEYFEETHAGKASPGTVDYQLDRHPHGVHSSHEPQNPLLSSITTPSYAVWNDTLSFDLVTAIVTPAYTWSFSPNYVPTVGYRGYAYEGLRTTIDDTWGWAVWVR